MDEIREVPNPVVEPMGTILPTTESPKEGFSPTGYPIRTADPVKQTDRTLEKPKEKQPKAKEPEDEPKRPAPQARPQPRPFKRG